MYPVQHRSWITLSEQQQAQLKLLLLEADPDWAQISSYLLQADIFVILDEQDHLIAQLCLSQQDHQAEIKNLAVAQSVQGQGLAKALIQYTIGYVMQLMVQTLWVKTGNSSLDQLALYQKCGFRMSHIERDVFTNYPEPIYENGIRCLDQVVLVIEFNNHAL
ncbi:GNAT family N-acetyltransferase [Acinetobacter sp. NIPH 2699]|uniref:GNAT family N-acetyltransferase n=1 Tax=Acinetobacter sp. NIPH 2699 TaxID=2923433 RepID=UPI001F4ABE60|nr:GNAT family N-acetyltransferase [Acinetobacter sp. NIPH 2699]MCH7337271.1 GNAT family N-acetyltransferase [Acinetobacter sp. NIPH 2699]